MDYGFDVMFNVFPIIFGVMFCLIIAVFITVFVKSARKGIKNSRSPVLTVRSRVVSKRDEYHGGHNSSGYTDYYATFEVQSGDRMELELSGEEYGMLVEGDGGNLTFQGTKFLSFDRD